MPIYEYKCTKCGKQFEVMQRMTDSPLSECSSCGGRLKKLITNTSFVLKGGGWYVTDYPSPERKKALAAKKGVATKSESSGDAKDKKTDAKKEKAPQSK